MEGNAPARPTTVPTEQTHRGAHCTATDSTPQQHTHGTTYTRSAASRRAQRSHCDRLWLLRMQAVHLSLPPPARLPPHGLQQAANRASDCGIAPSASTAHPSPLSRTVTAPSHSSHALDVQAVLEAWHGTQSAPRTVAVLGFAAAVGARNGTVHSRPGGESNGSGTAASDGAATATTDAAVSGEVRRPVAMNSQPQQQSQQQQQHPPTHYTFHHTPTFAPLQQPSASSQLSYFPPLPRPQLQPHNVNSSGSSGAAHFPTSVSFPTHGPPGHTHSHSAFSQPFPVHQPGSLPLAFPSHPSLPPTLPLSHSSFALRAAGPHPPPPPVPFPPPLPLPAPAAAPHSAVDPALLHASFSRLSGVDSSAYFPASSAPLTSPGYASQSFTYSVNNPVLSSSLPMRSVRASVWHCPLGCGQSYKKSSGRSIRRHFVSCFRQHNQAAASSMTDSQLSGLIAERQDTGQLQTGLRRWRMRSSRRRVDELRDEERWECVWGCGKRYRSTSTRSIQRHIADCERRPQVPGARAPPPRRATTSVSRAGRESEGGDDDEDEESEEEEMEEEEWERELRSKVQRATTSHAPVATPAAYQSTASPADTAPSPASSSQSSTLPSALTTAGASASSSATGDQVSTRTAVPSTLQSLSSAATHSAASEHASNNNASVSNDTPVESRARAAYQGPQQPQPQQTAADHTSSTASSQLSNHNELRATEESSAI